MASEIRVPDYSNEDLRRRADEFLAKFNSSGRIPVPIEEIAELQAGINVVPIPGLMRDFEIDAFISSDFSTITVDDDMYRNHITRYHFTLAHELAHWFLHSEVYKELNITRIEDWEEFLDGVSELDYAVLEGHANRFAGLVLVPTRPLAHYFSAAVEKAEKAGIRMEKHGDIALPYLAKEVAATFAVSASVVEIRVRNEGLMKPKLK